MQDPPKVHWETIYQTKRPDEVSWTEAVPKTSLEFVHRLHIPKDASIIDIGGGDSKFVDYLLMEGYDNITVLDISHHALDRAQMRLGEKANDVEWIVSDITEFQPPTTYDLWHDRAAFHFLTTPSQVSKYCSIARQAIKAGGHLIVGTFSTDGPNKCSGLTVKQYSEESIVSELRNGFDKIECKTVDHITPFHTTQNFLFCSFMRMDT